MRFLYTPLALSFLLYFGTRAERSRVEPSRAFLSSVCMYWNDLYVMYLNERIYQVS